MKYFVRLLLLVPALGLVVAALRLNSFLALMDEAARAGMKCSSMFEREEYEMMFLFLFLLFHVLSAVVYERIFI